jgi:hypothetical protein
MRREEISLYNWRRKLYITVQMTVIQNIDSSPRKFFSVRESTEAFLTVSDRRVLYDFYERLVYEGNYVCEDQLFS